MFEFRKQPFINDVFGEKTRYDFGSYVFFPEVLTKINKSKSPRTKWIMKN